MTMKGNDNPTNREETAEARTPDQPSTMPRMSPPTMSGMIQPPVDPGRKGWAIAAFVLGILSFCVPILPLLTIPFGIIALILIANNPGKYGGKGLAIVGIIVSGAALAIWVLPSSIALPSLARARELSKRSVCAANLKGIGGSLAFYAGENSNQWPSPYDSEAKLTPPGGVDYVGAISSHRGRASDPNSGDITRMQTIPDRVSTTRCLWALIRAQMSIQISFICPSANDLCNSDEWPQHYWDFGVGDITGPATSEQVRQGWSQVSYGYQVPFGKSGKPSPRANTPLMADKGPFGAALDAGLPAPPQINANDKSSAKQWRPWNSPNHGGQGGGEGQNVLYADGHVDWVATPLAGVRKDNIYTQQSGGELGEVQGNRPAPGLKLTPAGDADTLIYP